MSIHKSLSCPCSVVPCFHELFCAVSRCAVLSCVALRSFVHAATSSTPIATCLSPPLGAPSLPPFTPHHRSHLLMLLGLSLGVTASSSTP